MPQVLIRLEERVPSAKNTCVAMVLVLLTTPYGLGEGVLFEVTFEGGLSDKWEVVERLLEDSCV